MPSAEVCDPAVRALIDAINAGWADREIFSSNGHMDVLSAADEGTRQGRPERVTG